MLVAMRGKGAGKEQETAPSLAVSCVIPTRDRADLVCRAIASVLAQETPVAEIIVVDDGSVDGTSRRVAARFPGVRILSLPGLGPGPARNAGAAAARGDLLMFLDSDDVWLPGHVTALRRTIARGFAVAYGVTRNRDRLSGGEFAMPEKDAAPQGDCLAALARWCFLLPSAVALRQEAFRDAGGFRDPEPGEDWSFFIRLADRYAFGFCGEEPVTLRDLHAGSLSARVCGERLDRLLASVAGALAECAAAAAEQARFAEMAAWTRERAGNWSSIQQWYLALQQENFL